MEIDHLVDRGLTSVDGHLGGQIDLFPADHPRAIAASAIRQALFPQGDLAITRQPFVQQRVDVARLLDAYEAPELAPARAALPELEHTRWFAAHDSPVGQRRPLPQSTVVVHSSTHALLVASHSAIASRKCIEPCLPGLVWLMSLLLESHPYGHPEGAGASRGHHRDRIQRDRDALARRQHELGGGRPAAPDLHTGLAPWTAVFRPA